MQDAGGIIQTTTIAVAQWAPRAGALRLPQKTTARITPSRRTVSGSYPQNLGTGSSLHRRHNRRRIPPRPRPIPRNRRHVPRRRDQHGTPPILRRQRSIQRLRRLLLPPTLPRRIPRCRHHIRRSTPQVTPRCPIGIRRLCMGTTSTNTTSREQMSTTTAMGAGFSAPFIIVSDNLWSHCSTGRPVVL